MAVRRLANPVTPCDGHGVFFVAARGQIRMAADTGRSWRSRQGGPAARLRPGRRAVGEPGDARPGEHGSAALCRGGQLDRIRSGVYQWSAGRRAARRVPAARQADVLPPGLPAARPGNVSAAELFGQLFPDGVQLTGELLADLEQWARLTGKLARTRGL